MGKRMSNDRIAIKQQLALKRQVHTSRGPVLVCDLCGIWGATDLHEVILERDDVQGNDELTKRITEDPVNLQFLCNKCNIGRAKERKWRLFLIGRQIDRAGRAHFGIRLTEKLPEDKLKLIDKAGRDYIEQWILSLGLRAPGPHIARLNEAASLL